MATITITTGPREYTLLLQNSRSASQSLSAILGRYLPQNDQLSLRIHQWGRSVFILESSSQYTLDQKMQLASIKVNDLVTNILISPFDNTPLREPVIENGIVWERTMYENFRRNCPTSPFVERQILGNPVPHAFAEEMIKWAQKHTQKHQSPPSAEVVAFRDMRQELGDFLAHYRETQIAIQNESEALIDEAERRSKMHEEDVKAKLESIEKTNEEKLAKLFEQVNFMEEAHQEDLLNLEQQMNSMSEANQAVAQELKEKIEKQNEAHKENMGTLQQEIKKIEKSNAEIRSSLEGSVEARDKMMDKMHADHTATTTRLTQEIHRTQGQVSQLAQANQGLQQQALEQRRRADGLAAQVSASQAQVRQLQDEVDDSDSSCTMM
jgi:septal ring factor EnvC (AmiA/AmiB activator)